MNNIEVIIVTEGQTEQTFIREILAPHMALKNIFLRAALIGTPGHKGGNVKFDRAMSDIKKFLEQRTDTFVSMMIDYFRMDPAWPGYEEIYTRTIQGTYYTPLQKAETLQKATHEEIIKFIPQLKPHTRFIPYISMHEFEALLFSDPTILAKKIGVKANQIQKILDVYKGDPEEINNNPDSAPSKRLIHLNKSYRKVAMGSAISLEIGIDKIRQSCENFNNWILNLENLAS